MEYTTTSGETTRIPNMCGFCSLNTGGGHEPNCPMGLQIGWFDPGSGTTVFYTPRVMMQDSMEKE